MQTDALCPPNADPASQPASRTSWPLPRLLNLAELFKVLGDHQRMILLANLSGRAEPATVTEAATCCGVHISGVSRHLALLRQAGIVRADKVGREVRYSLNARELAASLRAVADWLEAGPGCCACAPQDVDSPQGD